MNTNDPIEELFRKRSNETVGEKPRDLVWKRIESGLKDDEKKKKPIREFISGVWFSAAVFALIAIPYFVLFIENINSAQNKQDSIEFVKTSTSSDNSVQEIKIDTIQTAGKLEDDFDDAIQVVKNDKSAVKPVYKVIENNAAAAAGNAGGLQNYSLNSADAPALLNSPQILEERTRVLDSIEKKGQYAVASGVKSEKKVDSISAKTSAPMAIRGSLKLKDTTDKMNMNVVPMSSATASQASDSAPLLEVTPKKAVVNKAEITYRPVKLMIKSDIVRTNFSLLKKTPAKVSFQNRSIIVSFEKVKNTIILTTNEPNIDPTILGVLEKNKKEIFNYYQKVN